MVKYLINCLHKIIWKAFEVDFNYNNFMHYQKFEDEFKNKFCLYKLHRTKSSTPIQYSYKLKQSMRFYYNENKHKIGATIKIITQSLINVLK